eukprot:TRINITY_DN55626_c0_g1_i1.p2 TRINITY_DN55626_c0_g1~~TRINITY_DN55626_c0_g1_i1.p2  ORF type:complete len:147 (+),score=38.61 TRINITY_DN55626_c0_g1_i1:59-499(+)
MLRSLVGSEMCIRDRSGEGLVEGMEWLGREVRRATLPILVPEQGWSPEVHSLRSDKFRLKMVAVIVSSRQGQILPVDASHPLFEFLARLMAGCDRCEVLGDKTSTIFLPGECACACLLYTSDAADEEDSVDFGGRRIIKKKRRENM